MPARSEEGRTRWDRLLYVDDRPSTLTEALLRRRDISPVLLRFSNASADLPPEHLRMTAATPTFTVDCRRALADEAGRFRDWAATSGADVRHFLNPSEPRQEVSQRFARLVGLPALSERQVDWVRDKLSMKRRLGELGFTVARHRPVEDRGEIASFAEEVGWPVVVKPRDGFACIDTHRVTARDLPGVRLDPTRGWIAEQWQAGHEYECCALVFAGEVLDTYPSACPCPPLAATEGATNANISGRDAGRGIPCDLTALVQRIVDGFGLDHGYFHMELFVGSYGAITISEVCLRLAGCEIPANHGLAYGFPVFDALLDIHTGRRPALRYTRQRCVGDLLLPLRPGVIIEMTPLRTLLGRPGVIGGRMKVAVGDDVRPRRASHACAGYVHVEGESVRQVKQRMSDVLTEFELHVRPRVLAGEAS